MSEEKKRDLSAKDIDRIITYVLSKQVGSLLIGKRRFRLVTVCVQPVSKGCQIPTAHLQVPFHNRLLTFFLTLHLTKSGEIVILVPFCYQKVFEGTCSPFELVSSQCPLRLRAIMDCIESRIHWTKTR